MTQCHLVNKNIDKCKYNCIYSKYKFWGMRMLEKRTSKKSETHKAVRKMLSMKAEYWEKADYMADMDGTTRSAIVAQAIECFWNMRMKEENDEKI